MSELSENVRKFKNYLKCQKISELSENIINLEMSENIRNFYKKNQKMSKYQKYLQDTIMYIKYSHKTVLISVKYL